MQRPLYGVSRWARSSIPFVRRAVLAHEVVVQGSGFLAEQVYLVAGAHQGAAKVLHVDVAPGAGEHVTVGDEQFHDREDSRAAQRPRMSGVLSLVVGAANSIELAGRDKLGVRL